MTPTINIRATLRNLPIGERFAIRIDAVENSLRHTASALGAYGYKFHVRKTERGFIVWRES